MDHFHISWPSKLLVFWDMMPCWLFMCYHLTWCHIPWRQWSGRSCCTRKGNTFKNIRKQKKATCNKRWRFFTDSRIDDKSIVLPVVPSDKVYKNPKLVVLHQNICSLRRKTTELEVLLCSELQHIDVICLIEHWQSDQKLNCTNIVDFKLASTFCRSGGDCIMRN